MLLVGIDWADSDGLLEIYADNALIRVRRGIRVFWRGLQERNPEDRLHQFVRSLDAIVMSRDGDEFGQRAKTFASGTDVEGILRQSYTLRSMNEPPTRVGANHPTCLQSRGRERASGPISSRIGLAATGEATSGPRPK